MSVVIASRRIEGIRVLTVHGEADPQTASDLSAPLAAAASETLRVVVDLRRVEELDLDTGRLLLVAACAIRERGGRLAAIVSRSSSTARLVEELSTDDELDVFDGLEAGLSGLARSSAPPPAPRSATVASIHRHDGFESDPLAEPFASALDSLSYREGKILEWRFGLFGAARVSYREIGRRLSMHASSVREAEGRALHAVERGPA